MSSTIWCVALIVLSVLAISLADDAEPEIEELKIEILHKPEECDRTSAKGNSLKMHYTGTLLDGTKFDSSLDRGQPFQFQLGAGMVIKGWDQGLNDMCIGEKRKLTIPSKLGYGKKGSGQKIPADATLLFDVELIDIEDSPQPKNVFKEIDVDGDGQLTQDEVRGQLMRTMKRNTKEVQDFYKDPKNVNAHVDKMFNADDTNRDGYISKREFFRRFEETAQENALDMQIEQELRLEELREEEEELERIEAVKKRKAEKEL